MLLAKLKDSWPHKFPLRACAGTEFVKNEWRPVPVSHEKEAENHEWLETRDHHAPEPVATLPPTDEEGTPIITNMPDDEPPARRGRRGVR